jgi:hypothetical protein
MLKESELSLANCRKNIVPTSMFFEDFEEIDVKQRMKVVKLCNDCKIKESCLKDAMEHKETYGLWGGKFFKKGNIIDPASIRRSRPAKSLV